MSKNAISCSRVSDDINCPALPLRAVFLGLVKSVAYAAQMSHDFAPFLNRVAIRESVKSLLTFIRFTTSK